MTDQAQQKAQELTEQAKERTSEVKDQAQSAVRRQIDERTSQTGIAIHSTAQDLRTVGQELRNQGKETPAKVADQIAEKGDALAGYLRTNDADRIVRDVEDFARRQPWAVIAGGMALGFVASRLLKASSEKRYTGSSFGGSSSAPSGNRVDTDRMRYTSTRSTDEIRSGIEDGHPSQGVDTGPSGSGTYGGI